MTAPPAIASARGQVGFDYEGAKMESAVASRDHGVRPGSRSE
jgi:hypothetical protein